MSTPMRFGSLFLLALLIVGLAFFFTEAIRSSGLVTSPTVLGRGAMVDSSGQSGTIGLSGVTYNTCKGCPAPPAGYITTMSACPEKTTLVCSHIGGKCKYRLIGGDQTLSLPCVDGESDIPDNRNGTCGGCTAPVPQGATGVRFEKACGQHKGEFACTAGCIVSSDPKPEKKETENSPLPLSGGTAPGKIPFSSGQDGPAKLPARELYVGDCTWTPNPEPSEE